MVPLIIDRQIPASSACGASLLSVPLGAHSLLEHILGWLGERPSQSPIVVPAFDVEADYAETLAARCSRPLRVFSSGPSEAIHSLEAADRVMVLDAARVPLLSGHIWDRVEALADYRGAAHLVALGRAGVTATRERVDLDDQGQVRRVQRLLGAACWPQVANRTVLLSLVPAGLLEGLSLAPLDHLREALAVRGVLTRDEPFDADPVDLTRPAGLLMLNEQLTVQASRQDTHRRLRSIGNDVLVGHGCEIDPSARLVGPLVIHDQTVVGEHATIVGPAVIGCGCRIEAGAAVARTIVLPDTLVAAGTVISHAVVGAANGSQTRTALGSGALACVPPTAMTQALRLAPEPQQPPRVARRVIDQACKRLFDVCCAGTLLVLLSPVLVFVALLIKLGSRGPVFFKHRRESAGGVEFDCLKFRTMVADAHRRQRELYNNSEVDGPQFKIESDPRVTRLGAILRATNIDELPQLLNVLRGDMSLVGPRPSPLRENQICIPWRRARLSVRPGITGLWQVCRSVDRSQGDFHEWIYYDINYVRHFSIWLDLRILIATVLSLGGRKSVPMDWVLKRRAQVPGR